MGTVTASAKGDGGVKVDIASTLLVSIPPGTSAKGHIFLVKVESPSLASTAMAAMAMKVILAVVPQDTSTWVVAHRPPIGEAASREVSSVFLQDPFARSMTEAVWSQGCLQ